MSIATAKVGPKTKGAAIDVAAPAPGSIRQSTMGSGDIG
jgi:hypothetical protein